jgi:hypothetical protein
VDRLALGFSGVGYFGAVLGLPTVNKKPKQHSHTHDADNPSRPIHDFIQLRAWFSPVSHKRFLAMDNEGAWQPPHYPFDSCADDV